VQVYPVAHTVAPEYPVPPHWPYSATVPVEVEAAEDEVFVDEATVLVVLVVFEVEEVLDVFAVLDELVVEDPEDP